jgi:predicted enzyme related to lactoylglutathione lyase
VPALLGGLTVLASDPAAQSSFWQRLLGLERRDATLLPGAAFPFPITFVATDEPLALPSQTHLHLTSNASTQEETIARAVDLGASYVDVGQQPGEDHVVLADPEGNAFCVIEAGNRWLAGTPLLGELACDGTREVGLFWSAALGWPLVHDQDGETAIQQDPSGPKIAWGGAPLDERHGRNRAHLELVAEDVDAEVERLVALGATLVAHGADVELADPDGNEFHLRRDS